MKAKVSLGCTPSTPDKRDFLYQVAPLLKLPPKVDLRKNAAPIFNQGQLGACTGFGISRAYRQLLQLQQYPVFQPSQLFIYYNERVAQNTVKSDSGASIRTGMKVITKVGVADINLWPYVTSKFTLKPPAAAFTDAAKIQHKALQYQSLNSLSEIKAALAQGLSVVIGFSVYTNFFDIGADGMMPEPQGSMEGGHCVTIDGYRDDLQRFICSNSWSTSWGAKGYFFMPYSFLDHVFDKWVIQKV